MASKLTLPLQSAWVELPVDATDVTGKTSTIRVGFKRHKRTPAQERIKNFEAANRVLNQHLTDPTKPAPTDEENRISNDEVTRMLTEDIIYLKNVEIIPHKDGKPQPKLVIEDTRKVLAGDFWDNPESCLQILVQEHMESTPWQQALINAWYKALVNINFDQDKAKN